MRRYLLIMNLGWLLTLVAFVGINWLVDPYRIFHKPWVRENYYATDHTMREAAAGIINTEDFDAVIMGSSIAANFSSTEASEVFGRRFVNITMDGSGVQERSLVLNYALTRKIISIVIISIDWGSLGIEVEQSPVSPFSYLYDDYRLNDLLIYAKSPKVFRYVLCRNLLVSSNLLCPNTTEDLEALVKWDSDRFGGLHSWLEAKNDGQVKNALKEITNSIRIVEADTALPVELGSAREAISKGGKVFEDTLIRIAALNPSTLFYLFFPPYSRLNFAILKQSNPQGFEEYIGILRLVVNEVAMLPNVKVFGFETEDFLDDIANYKDTIHYHQRFNSAMFGWMKNGEHELTPENLEPYIHDITKRAAAYPLQEIGTQIDAYLRHGEHSEQPCRRPCAE